MHNEKAFKSKSHSRGEAVRSTEFFAVGVSKDAIVEDRTTKEENT
jgi:hypothetical protein